MNDIEASPKGVSSSQALHELEKIVSANVSVTSNEARSKAEAELLQMRRRQPANYFTGLCALMTHSSDPMVRSFAAVLLRQILIVTDDTFDNIPFQCQTHVRQTLLSCCVEEKNRDALLAVSNALGQCAIHILCKAHKWEELLPTMMKLASSSDSSHREAFLIVLDKLAEFAMDVLRKDIDRVRTMLISALKDKVASVRTAALRAVVSLLLSLDKNDELKYFSGVIPLLFQSIAQSAGDDVVVKACENLHHLVENRPEFFAQYMKPIVDCLSKCIAGEQLSFETRRIAMGLLLSLIEVNIGNCNEKEVAAQVIPLSFLFVQHYDDSLEWSCPDDDTEQVDFQFGCDSLTQLCILFGGETFLSIAQPIITKGLKSEEWITRVGSLFVMKGILDEVSGLWQSHLDTIVNAVGNCLAHSKAQVKYAALHAIQQLSVSYAEHDFQSNYHRPVMGALLEMLHSASKQHRCVAVQTCDALAHFAYYCKQELFSEYGERSLKSLYEVLVNCKDSLIQSFALKAVSVIVGVLEDQVAPYYDRFLALCLKLLQETQGKLNLCELRGRVMECFGQLCANGPLEKCKDHCHQILQMLIPIQEKEKALGGVSYNFMMKLFNRLSEVLEGDFVKYLQHIIPPLIQSAQLNPTSMSDAKDPDEVGISCQGSVISTSIHLHAFGSKKITVNTSEVEEKTIACKLLVSYASQMDGEFLEYTKAVTKVMKPLLEYKCHNSTRRSAAESVPVLLHCIIAGLTKKESDKDLVSKAVSSYIKEMMVPFLRCMEIEDEVEAFSSMCSYLLQILDSVEELKQDPCRYISEDMVGDMAQQVTSAISERILRHFNQEELGEDGAAEEYSEDIEAELADNLSDVVAKLCKLFGARFVEVFDKVCAEQVKELLDQSVFVVSDYILGLTIFAEVIRYGQKLAGKYSSLVLKTCQQALQEKPSSAGLRQSVAYAIGICSEQQVLVDADEWLKELKRVVDIPNAREEDQIMATENAISAIGKICRNQSKQIEDWNKKVIVWIQMLPLSKDVDERECCNAFVLTLMQNSFDDLVKLHPNVVAKWLEVMAVAIKNNDKQSDQFKRAFEFLCSKLGATNVRSMVSKLSDDLQKVFPQ